MNLPDLPRATRKELANPAPPGGRHSQIVKIAFALSSRGWDRQAIYLSLRPNYGNDVSDSEIHSIIDWAGKSSFRDGPKNPITQSIALKKSLEMVSPGELFTNATRFLRGFNCGEADLWEASPVRPSVRWIDDAFLLLSHAFFPGERINIVPDYLITGKKARPVGHGITATREKWLEKLANKFPPSSKAGSWIRINPTDGKGIADKNVAAFRFALLEFDYLELNLQLAVFARLPLPIFAILTSGGKSLHAWIRLDAVSAENYRQVVDRIFESLRPVGIDPGNRNPGRLSRLPGVLREVGACGSGRQRLLYLNPDAKEWRPIL